MRRRSLLLGLALLLALVAAVAAYRFLAWRAARVDFQLLPGRSAWEVARTIERTFPGQGAPALALIQDLAFARSLGLDLPPRAPRPDGVPATWLEGYLFPETYKFPPDSDARAVLSRAVAESQRVLAGLQQTEAAAFLALQRELGLSVADVVTLASLVEEETGRRDEAPIIAGVFLNRLRQGMRLQTDPTLVYHPDRVGRAPTPTDRRDPSNPYNTYQYKGLPPGPICSPTRGALLAVLHATAHDYLYFVAKRDGQGGSAFAETLGEHSKNIDRYLRRTPSPAGVAP